MINKYYVNRDSILRSQHTLETVELRFLRQRL